MLTEVKNNYKSILKHFDFDESISSAEYNKQKLAEMAKSGKPRPSQKTKLGGSLVKYTTKTSTSYCKKFDKLIRKLAPSWFISRTQIANQKKQQLIEMAKNKKPRPSCKTKEGQALRNYISKHGSAYCPKFDKAIRKFAPNWFASTSQIMKYKLIQMARSKKPRPTQKIKEGIALSGYTRKSSSSYCPDFNKRIRKLAPNWFISITQIADHMKRKLIQMARSKQSRPSDKTKEGRSLFNYTSKSRHSSYCPEFDKIIRKLRPDWFRKCSPK